MQGSSPCTHGRISRRVCRREVVWGVTLSGGDVQSFDRAVCAQFGSDDPQNFGMENQREMSDVAQNYDSRERRGMQHVLGRRGHDRIVVAENPDLVRTSLAV